MSHDFKCFQCGNSLEFLLGSPIGRSECCSQCNSDVRVCRNCEHYDTQAYNECKETMAERVVDKDRSNFCDYFRPGKPGAAAGLETKEDVFKKLDDLFKS